MFTGRPGLGVSQATRFAQALFAMKYENPKHREILDLEGLKRWVAPSLEGYASLKRAGADQGFLGPR
jgi:ABC-type phosphate/phosphonate transport system substrate-binding protein